MIFSSFVSYKIEECYEKHILNKVGREENRYENASGTATENNELRITGCCIVKLKVNRFTDNVTFHAIIKANSLVEY